MCYFWSFQLLSRQQLQSRVLTLLLLLLPPQMSPHILVFWRPDMPTGGRFRAFLLNKAKPGALRGRASGSMCLLIANSSARTCFHTTTVVGFGAYASAAP